MESFRFLFQNLVSTMVICAVAGCSNRSGRDPVTFSRIPSKKLPLYYNYLRRADIDRQDFMRNGNAKYRICSAHFDDSSFHLDGRGRKVLNDDAIPLPPKSVSTLRTDSRRGQATESEASNSHEVVVSHLYY